MKIAVINECFLSEDNLATLKSIGELTVFPHTTTDEDAISRIKGQDIVFADMFEAPLKKNVLQQADRLKLLCINSTGYDHVDLETAREKGISVAHVPGFSTEAVAENSFGLALSLLRHIPLGDQLVRESLFQINPANSDHRRYLGTNLFGKTFGIYGLGAIGQHMAKIAHGFGMKIIAHNRNPKTVPNVQMVSLDELLSHADILALSAAYTPSSHNFINAETLAKMKKTATLVSIMSPHTVDSEALAKALIDGTIAGAALDHMAPWKPDNPLLKAPNTIFTPQSSWFTREALVRIGEIMTSNAEAFARGKKQNLL